MTRIRKNSFTRMEHRLREGWFLLTLAIAFFLLISLFTYSPHDPSWSETGTLNQAIANLGGRAGAFVADVLLLLFGIAAYFFPVILILSSWLNRQSQDNLPKRILWLYQWIGWGCFLISFASLASFYFYSLAYLPANAGGMIGSVVGQMLLSVLNKTGSTLFFVTLALFGMTVLTGVSWAAFAEKIGEYLVTTIITAYKQLTLPKMIQRSSASPVIKKIEPLVTMTIPVIENKAPALPILPREKKVFTVDKTIQLKAGALPPTTLLNNVEPVLDHSFDHVSLETLSQIVEQRLLDFGVTAKVVSVLPGPVITRFELDLAPGIKVSKIVGLAKDIARSLSVTSVRVVEVIPGKSVIGLEIPNQTREIVMLRDIVESQRYAQSRSPISLVLGKDIAGHPVIVDLIKMPHLLVAGTTGSGKSVSLNAMLLSMLFKSTPEQLRLILIDPKMLELSLYDGIPHLLTPVITDMKEASNALRWCVAEMDRRYRLMASQGVRNLTGYNQKIGDAIKQGQPITMPSALVVDEASAKQTLEPLPLIVVIADELADMMMLVGKKIEDLIARIAQKARAAGIHLILATQRPSVDVITGLIKANIPTRIAFQVSSRIDSRTILDQQGAEQLLGHGDMLYLPPGIGVPVRVHGAYVADEEVHRVVAAWRSVGDPNYLHAVTEGIIDNSEEEGDDASFEKDPFYDEAVQIVTESRRASISLVQRRLRIGYNRAARMMEAMEQAGLVSAMDHNGSREVIIPE